MNQSDYLSRYAAAPDVDENVDDLSNLLFLLYTTPVTDCIGLDNIARETVNDPIFSQVKEYARKNQHWIPKTDTAEVQKFRSILPEISVSVNGILPKKIIA